MSYAIIVGGGKIGYFLARSLINRDYEVLLLEKDRSMYHQLAADLGDVVVHGDGCDPLMLQRSGVRRADLVVAATGDDADNLVISQVAAHCFGRTNIVARVNNPDHDVLFEMLGVRQRVSGTAAILHLLGQKIERASVILMGAIEQSNIEVVEIILDARSPFVGATLSNVKLPKEALVVSVLRGGNAMIPNAETTLALNDVVLILIPTEEEATLREFVA
jgi:trk system potassium uptake protein TrkA